MVKSNLAKKTDEVVRKIRAYQTERKARENTARILKGRKS